MSKIAALRKDIFCPVVNEAEILMQSKYYMGSKDDVYCLSDVEKEVKDFE